MLVGRERTVDSCQVDTTLEIRILATMKKTTKKLKLNRDVIRVLQTSALEVVHGGGVRTMIHGYTCDGPSAGCNPSVSCDC
jgi:hypothetical protein